MTTCNRIGGVYGLFYLLSRRLYSFIGDYPLETTAHAYKVSLHGSLGLAGYCSLHTTMQPCTSSGTSLTKENITLSLSKHLTYDLNRFAIIVTV